MQQTIANKVYDTDTAKGLGNWRRGISSERGYISETLYQIDSGDYFLYGEGGPRSRYAKRVAPNTWGYGERILPFTTEEAHAWADTHLTENAFDKVFGANATDEILTSVLIRLRPEVAQLLAQAASEQKCQMSDVAESLIHTALGKG